ncbi:MAG: phosphoribosylformylglycinamidine synthase subunit PurL [Deltaproteobacteria bacterium]|nr:phosphoribosylformylglycinamidine synthase subunit PurL [Deltaproteobacteria bacterium]
MNEPKVTLEAALEHGLRPEEYERARASVGRDLTWAELGVFSVMWSEHCSYKSSRVHLSKLPTKGPRVVQGPGENAGVVDIGDGWSVVFKMESHNHPSFIEPYQGAATGVGGILRDVFTMGARPVASLNSLRFGRPDHPRTPALVAGVVAGIGGYGNCIGVPTVGGEVAFHEAFDGNILVNAFTLGLARIDRIFYGRARGTNNPILYVGAKTGRDGIHGATMASAEFDDASDAKRPTVQVGDPFLGKLLLEACLEVMSQDLLEGIQDMGAAGLTSSSVEMAGRGGSGVRLDLDAVPRRATGMTAYEVLLSESQERMVLVARLGSEDAVRAIFRRWGLDAVVIGRVTDTGRFHVTEGGRTVCDLPVAVLTDEAPRYHRPAVRPEGHDALLADDPGREPGTDHGRALLELIGSPDLCSREWVYRQYDQSVRDGTVVGPGSDAAVVRLFTGDSTKAIALAVDCNSRHVELDPRAGGAMAVAEAARNIVCSGAEPLAVTDCLNFGNPERPDVMWQFVEAVEGIAEACRALETPVVSGNVSFYNETNGKAVLPTPTIGMVGLFASLDDRRTQWFPAAGLDIWLLGAATDGCLGGSIWAARATGRTSGPAPRLDLQRELAVQRLCLAAIREKIVLGAHDVSEGGLAVALAECCITGRTPIGARVPELPDSLPAHRSLFGEDPSRIVVSASPEDASALAALARGLGVPITRLGTTGGEELVIGGSIRLPIADLLRAWEKGLVPIVGGP